MHNFFHGWRRKLGCLTLVLACAMMAVWIRSRIVCDLVGIPNGERQTAIWSLDGKAYWFGCNADGGAWFVVLNQKPIAQLRDSLARQRIEMISRPVHEYAEWSTPYLPWATGLTLLSAYLILWKPRKPIPSASKPDA